MTPAVSIRLLLRWIRLLLFSWRSRTNWFVRNASVSWIEDVLLSPIMRRPTRSNSADNEDFESPEASEDETSYNLTYNSRAATFDPDGPSSSRAAAEAASRTKKFYARKSTSRGPHPPSTPTTRSKSQIVNAPSAEGSGRRKKTIPRKRRNQNVLFLREVRRLQSTTNLLIPKMPFGRLVRELLLANARDATRITSTALLALQEATEIYVTQTLNDAFLLTQHRKRVTLSVSDIQILRVLKLII